MMPVLRTISVATALLTVVPTGARAASDQAKPTAPAPVSSEPRETSASFGDWVSRCDRIGAEPTAKKVCEAAQTLVVKGQQQPVAQIAFARGEGGALLLTVLLPLNISFAKAPEFGIEGEEAKAIKLTLRRCIPAGCFAEAKIEAPLLAEFRSTPKAGVITFPDASERTIALPLSFRGLAQALDDLNKHS